MTKLQIIYQSQYLLYNVKCNFGLKGLIMSRSIKLSVISCFIILIYSGTASAADADQGGFYIAPAISFVEHHFTLEETTLVSTTVREVEKVGVGGAALAGYDFNVGNKILVGVRAQLDVGGGTPSTRTALGTVGIKPRWGYGLLGRAGLQIGGKSVVYGGVGYGGHKYGRISPPGVIPLKKFNNSFILSGGVEFQISRRQKIGFEFQHLDGTRNALMILLPIQL